MKFDRLPETILLESVLITSAANDLPTTPIESINVDLDGFPGDRHYGYNTLSRGREKPLYKRGTPICNLRQWSAVSVEELDQIRTLMEISELKPQWIGANLLFSGLDGFSKLPSFTRLRSKEEQGATLIVYEENHPCKFPHEHIEQGLNQPSQIAFDKAAKGLRGILGWVESPGRLSAGSEIEIWIPRSK